MYCDLRQYCDKHPTVAVKASTVNGFSYCDTCDSRKDLYQILIQIVVYEKRSGADTIGSLPIIASRFYAVVSTIKLFGVQHTGIEQYGTAIFIIPGSYRKNTIGAVDGQ